MNVEPHGQSPWHLSGTRGAESGSTWASTVSSAEPLTMLSEVEALSEAHGQRPWPESKGQSALARYLDQMCIAAILGNTMRLCS